MMWKYRILESENSSRGPSKYNSHFSLSKIIFSSECLVCISSTNPMCSNSSNRSRVTFSVFFLYVFRISSFLTVSQNPLTVPDNISFSLSRQTTSTPSLLVFCLQSAFPTGRSLIRRGNAFFMTAAATFSTGTENFSKRSRNSWHTV